MQQETWKRLWSLMKKVWSHKQDADSELYLLYWSRLGQLPDEAAERAISHLIDTSQWFPAVAEIKAAAIDSASREGLVRTSEAAWLEAKKIACQRLDYHTLRPTVDVDAILSQVVGLLGGWRAIRYASDEQMIWLRKEFMQIYEREQRYVLLTNPALIGAEDGTGRLSQGDGPGARDERRALPGVPPDGGAD